MRDHTPTVYLLAGSSGPAATTYARMLQAQGVIWLDGPDACGGPDRDGLGARLVAEVEAGRDVVLAEGLGERDDRAFYQRLVEEHGGQWCLIHLSNDHADTLRRLSLAEPPT